MGTGSLRRHVASELHDGVLQVLTAIAIRLDAAQLVLESSPEDARDLIVAIGRSVRAEQRELRMFVDELKGSELDSVAGRIPMKRRLAEMLRRVGELWGVSCTLDCADRLPDQVELGRTVLRLVQEATINAIRHGHATTVETRIRVAGDKLRIIVSDDGSGFRSREPVRGDVLVASRLGPVLLERRITDAGGRLRIMSGARGSHLFMRLPIDRPPRGAHH